MVLLTESEEELEKMVGIVKEHCEEWRLQDNVRKTKIMNSLEGR
jgi:hypothetical protein